MRVSFVMYFVALLSVSPVFAEIDIDVVSESIVRVRAYKNTRVIAEGSGFVVNAEGYVLTNAHLLSDANRLSVLALKTGAELSSQQIFASREMNLALLQAQGLGLPPLNLSGQGADVGRVVETLKLISQDSIQIARGTIGAYQDVPGKNPDDPVVHLLQHNAIVTSSAFGMPLFNECGDVIAINLPDPDSGRWPFRKEEPRGIIFALRSGDIITALKDREIAHTVEEEECLSAIERAQAREDSLRQAQAQTDSLTRAREDSLRQAQARTDSLTQAREDSIKKAAENRLKAEQNRLQAEQDRLRREQARTDSLAQAREDSLRRAQARTDSLERAIQDSIARRTAIQDSIIKKQVKASQYLEWAILSGAALVLLLLLGWFVFARSKKAQLQTTSSQLSEAEQKAEAAQRAAAQAPQPAPFRCLLEGQDNTGQSFVLNIPALALSAGATLGRNPANSEFIIDHESVSREHVRLFYADGNLYTEDLGSTNGTRINGNPLKPRDPVALQNNDQLELGPVVFQVRLIPE